MKTSGRQLSHGMRWLVTAAVALVAVMALACLLFAFRGPFARSVVTEALEEALSGTVEMKGFHRTYFPHLGCIASGLTIRSQRDAGNQPLITVEKLTIEDSLADVLRNRISEIRAEGLHVLVAPGSDLLGRTSSANPSKRLVKKFVADGAVVDFMRHQPGREPRSFVIERLALTSTDLTAPIGFQVKLLNPQPPGEIDSTGQLGPWRADASGETPVQGSYTFAHADLGAVNGIAGTLFSQGTFAGVLSKVEVQGITDVPDFRVKTAGHEVHLRTQFHAIVNGTDGNVLLEPVNAWFGSTAVESRGSIENRIGRRGKTTTIGITGKGEIQDLLRLFVREAPPAMKGAISFRSRASLPPERHPFLSQLALEGDFVIRYASFSDMNTQGKVNVLSARAQKGNKKKDEPGTVTCNLNGHVILRRGIATFSNLSFEVPGAVAQLSGTYSLLNEHIDVHGTLKTQASLSDSSKGLKWFLLEPLDPLFKKKHAGAEIGVNVSGTYDHPSFGVSLTRRRQTAAPEGAK